MTQFPIVGEQELPVNKLGVSLNSIEKEILLLGASVEAINSMVNKAMLSFSNFREQGVEIKPQTSTHLTLFSIYLVDFLTPMEREIFPNQSYLDGLNKICDAPNFDKNDSIAELKKAVKDFDTWLNHEVRFNDIWLPSINKKLSIDMRRNEFIKICGNLSKHHLPTIQATKIFEIIVKSGHQLKKSDGFLVLEEFYDWFHFDKFAYHLSTIAEFLNNIRWGIQTYLQPELENSYTIVEYPGIDPGLLPPSYKFIYPNGVEDNFSQACYWDLMNKVLSKPYIQRFQGSSNLKGHY